MKAYENTLTYKVEQRIEALPYNVVLRSDLADLGGERQVTYAINQLIKNKKIARVSYGVYAKTEPSSFFFDKTLLKSSRGFTGMVREALDRLKIPWQPSEAEEDYNSGRSTQVPARSILRLKKRFRRKISYGGLLFKFKQVN